MLLLNRYQVLILLISLNSQSLPIHATKLTLQSIFDLPTNKNGQAYERRTVKIDSAKHIEYFFGSPYANAADFIFDFKKNLTLIRVPTQRICYVWRAIDELPNSKNLKPFKPNEDVKTKTLAWRVSGTIRNKRILDSKMKQMCKGMAVFLITPADNEKPAEGQSKGSAKRSGCGGRLCYRVQQCYIPCYKCKQLCIPRQICAEITC
ncbi:uncharacterized protein LOC116306655 [Actinia tenebrosa]|uniref:Uncharacterized protein LOC116306655 n=1 Tax=Actinia tenebrosa TaxID=6105 RepID=A0A6P8IZG4_ACTTE|nr:uncharacterized protein LOC116306655 [Actinia tenebrosa]